MEREGILDRIKKGSQGNLSLAERRGSQNTRISIGGNMEEFKRKLISRQLADLRLLKDEERLQFEQEVLYFAEKEGEVPLLSYGEDSTVVMEFSKGIIACLLGKRVKRTYEGEIASKYSVQEHLWDQNYATIEEQWLAQEARAEAIALNKPSWLEEERILMEGW
jgi:hypothetical protein